MWVLVSIVLFAGSGHVQAEWVRNYPTESQCVKARAALVEGRHPVSERDDIAYVCVFIVAKSAD